MKPLFASLLFSVTALAADPPVADFSAPDINPGSDRRQATAAPVSPRNYLNQVSAWYFGRESCVDCRSQFAALAEIYDEIKDTTVLPVDIIGINQSDGGENLLAFAGKPLSWVRDFAPLHIQADWGHPAWREVIILGPDNVVVDRFSTLSNRINITDLDPSSTYYAIDLANNTANRAALKKKLVDAAKPVDSDNDKLPDFWERAVYGDLSRDRASIQPNGLKTLHRYAHCTATPPDIQPRIFVLPGGSVSVFFTRRRGTAFGLSVLPEFSRTFSAWESDGHGWEEWGVRAQYDGSCSEIVEWRILTPGAWRNVRIKTLLP